MRAPHRSLAAPQPNDPKAMTRKLIVIANDIPARDQPVSADMGARNTASENMVPSATQPMRPPSATMTQRYGDSLMSFAAFRPRLRRPSAAAETSGIPCDSAHGRRRRAADR